MGLLSDRINKVPPSETLALVARATQLRAEGKKVISFAAGELDFGTPTSIVSGTIDAIKAGYSKYAPAPGLPEFRRAVAAYMTRQSGVDITDQNVAVTVGAKQGIFNALIAVIDPGDSVLVLSPYWVSYPPMVMLAGGNPVIHETKPENGFKVTAEEIDRIAAGKKIRAVIMNSPSNPTGAVYAPGELSSVYEACRKHDIFILSDEIYSNLTFDGIEHFSAFHLEKRITDGYCVVDGMSKSFAMTGWRVGWVVGTPDLIKAVSKVTAQTTSCAVSFIQKGCVDALGQRLAEWDEWKRQLAKRRERIVSLLNAVPGVSCRKPDGSFYVWVDARELMSKTMPGGEALGSSDRFSKFLVEEAALIVVPGGAFGCEGFMRFSFALSMDEIEEGIELFKKSIEKLS